MRKGRVAAIGIGCLVLLLLLAGYLMRGNLAFMVIGSQARDAAGIEVTTEGRQDIGLAWTDTGTRITLATERLSLVLPGGLRLLLSGATGEVDLEGLSPRGARISGTMQDRPVTLAYALDAAKGTVILHLETDASRVSFDGVLATGEAQARGRLEATGIWPFVELAMAAAGQPVPDLPPVLVPSRLSADMVLLADLLKLEGITAELPDRLATGSLSLPFAEKDTIRFDIAVTGDLTLPFAGPDREDAAHSPTLPALPQRPFDGKLALQSLTLAGQPLGAVSATLVSDGRTMRLGVDTPLSFPDHGITAATGALTITQAGDTKGLTATVDAQATYAGEPLRLQAGLREITSLEPGTSLPTTAAITLTGLEAGIDGNLLLGPSPRLKGTGQIKADDARTLARVATSLGASDLVKRLMPHLVKMDAPVTLSTTLDAGPDDLAVSGTALEATGLRFDGAAKIAAGTSHIEGRLRAGQLDVDAINRVIADAFSPAGNGALPIPEMTAQLSLSVGSLTIANQNFSNVAVDLALRGNQVELSSPLFKIPALPEAELRDVRLTMPVGGAAGGRPLRLVASIDGRKYALSAEPGGAGWALRLEGPGFSTTYTGLVGSTLKGDLGIRADRISNLPLLPASFVKSLPIALVDVPLATQFSLSYQSGNWSISGLKGNWGRIKLTRGALKGVDTSLSDIDMQAEWFGENLPDAMSPIAGPAMLPAAAVQRPFRIAVSLEGTPDALNLNAAIRGTGINLEMDAVYNTRITQAPGVEMLRGKLDFSADQLIQAVSAVSTRIQFSKPLATRPVKVTGKFTSDGRILKANDLKVAGIFDAAGNLIVDLGETGKPKTELNLDVSRLDLRQIFPAPPLISGNGDGKPNTANLLLSSKIFVDEILTDAGAFTDAAVALSLNLQGSIANLSVNVDKVGWLGGSINGSMHGVLSEPDTVRLEGFNFQGSNLSLAKLCVGKNWRPPLFGTLKFTSLIEGPQISSLTDESLLDKLRLKGTAEISDGMIVMIDLKQKIQKSETGYVVVRAGDVTPFQRAVFPASMKERIVTVEQGQMDATGMTLFVNGDANIKNKELNLKIRSKVVALSTSDDDLIAGSIPFTMTGTFENPQLTFLEETLPDGRIQRFLVSAGEALGAADRIHSEMQNTMDQKFTDFMRFVGGKQSKEPSKVGRPDIAEILNRECGY